MTTLSGVWTDIDSSEVDADSPLNAALFLKLGQNEHYLKNQLSANPGSRVQLGYITTSYSNGSAGRCSINFSVPAVAGLKWNFYCALYSGATLSKYVTLVGNVNTAYTGYIVWYSAISPSDMGYFRLVDFAGSTILQSSNLFSLTGTLNPLVYAYLGT